MVAARKNGENAIDINYKCEAGNEATFVLHPRAIVLIPLFHLARNLEKNNRDAFELSKENSQLPLPFSTGPNACPGRNIGYAGVGVLLGNIIKRRLAVNIHSIGRFEPKVSLTLSNLDIEITEVKGSSLDI